MKMDKQGDLVINGFGSSNGGQFQHVTINGKGTVNSDVECTEFKCNGSGTVQGNINAKTAHISGNAKIIGKLESETLTVDGTAKIEHSLHARKLKVSGKATVGGKLKSEEIIIQGRLIVEEDCEAETFTAESQFKIGGLLTADHIVIKMYGDCQAKEIGGQTIIVKQKKGSLSLLGLFKPVTRLNSELIEGDHIEIENTNAKIVRGKHVTIGPNCEITLVEYTDELTIDKKAIVGENRKV